MEMQLDGGTPADTRKTLHKQFQLANENILRILMKVDAVEIPSERTEARAARKALVVKANREMEAVDKLIVKCAPEVAPGGGNSSSGDPDSDLKVIYDDSR